MILVILSYIPALICGVHCVRTGQNMTWIWLLIIGGPLGAAIYFFAVLLPDLAGSRSGRGAAMAVRRLVTPQAEFHRALKTLEETPTVGARIKVAQAAAALGRFEDAEAQWALAASGIFADDPAVLIGHAQSLLEIGRYQDALNRLERLQKLGAGETGHAALAFARAYEGLDRAEDADAPYRYAADHVPGLEAGARYIAFMARTGRQSDAEIGLAELDRRIKKIAPPLRNEARQWRDFAATAVAGVNSDEG